MQIWGKILGFLFGFMLSKTLFGGLLGLWLGHSFDKAKGLNFNRKSGFGDVGRQAEFFTNTFSVMGYVAKANGQVSSHEIAFATAYMDKLGLTGVMRQQAQEAFREGKSSEFPLEEKLRHLKSICASRNDLLLIFLEIQIQVAFADGELDGEERVALHNIARLLGFSAHDLDKLLEMIIAGAQFNQGAHAGRPGFNSKTQLENAYKVLGVDESSSEKEIKKAYRKLMSQHHPDKLIAKGLPPEMMESAKQKTQDIQAAYEMIAKK